MAITLYKSQSSNVFYTHENMVQADNI